MKETVRIHIAKSPYDIEVDAKKSLDRYIKDLDSYADDPELLRDIEIRITELLAERGVVVNGVISSDDVSAIRNQLGEPKDFLDEKKPRRDIDDSEEINRRLFRNCDNAILGGVMSGLASYFKVNPIWPRLIFVFAIFCSFGTAVLVYLIMWLIIPPAKTVAEKLQMSGKVVNIESIRELNEGSQDYAQENERASIVRRMLSLIIGTGFFFASLGTLIFTVFAAIGIFQYNLDNSIFFDNDWMIIVAYILAIIAGSLLSILFALGSYVFYAHKFNKKIFISAIAIIASGLISFGTAVGLVSYQALQPRFNDRNSVSDSKIETPKNFQNVKKIIIDIDDVNLSYQVDETAKVEFHSLPSANKPILSVNEDALTVRYAKSSYNNWIQIQPTINIYGPKLDSIDVKSGSISYESKGHDLNINLSGDNSSMNLSDGVYGKIDLNISDGAVFNATEASVGDISVDSKSGKSISLGNINNLIITQPEICPANSMFEIEVQNVSSNNIKYNGLDAEAKTNKDNCISIIVGN